MSERKSLGQLFVPICIETLFYMLAGMVDTLMLSSVGDHAVGAVGTANTYIGMFIIMFSVISTGMMAVMTQNIGAGKPGIAYQARQIGVLFNIVLGLAIGVILFFGGELVLDIVGIATVISKAVNLCIVFVASNKLVKAKDDPHRLPGKEVFKQIIKIGFPSAMESAFTICAEPIMSLFTDDPEMVAIVAKLLAIDIVLEIGRATNLVFGNALKTSGDALFPVIIGAIFMFLCTVCGTYFFGIRLELMVVGAYIALALDECTRAVAMFLRWQSGKWREKGIVQDH